ncbi:MAG: exopolysaccharide biosynthesis polyprenyl glycosylphosphotransferase [Clostridia bacterium]|nr:exopolysaccharide biosynthesis polyprenyl glycosylphosphotransferase [Clostridia bacterium]
MINLHRAFKRHRSALVMGLISLAVYASLLLVFFGIMGINNWPLRHASRTSGITLVTFVAMTLVMAMVYGGFEVGRKKNKPIISSMTLAVVVVDLVTYLQLQIMNVNENNNDHLVLFGRDFPYLLLCILLQFLVIILFVRIGNSTYFRMNPPRRCLLVLADRGEESATRRKIDRYRLQWHVEKVAMFDDPHLIDLIRSSETVILSGLPAEDQMRILHQCYDLQKDVLCRAQLEDIMLSNARQVIVDDAAFLAMDYRKMTILQRLIKRGMDVLFSALVLLVLSPLMAVIALCIHFEDGGKVIFRQKRMSVNGRIFTICKFRTMSEAASSSKHQVSASADDARITKIGHFLRRTRLDELPQFWNILKGDMTLVGPRPEMLENVEKYKQQLPAFVYREKMKAGLTGYAQIEGRYNTTPEDKLMLDLMYIESFSIWLDIKLLFRTLTVFFKSDSTEGFAQAQDDAAKASK